MIQLNFIVILCIAISLWLFLRGKKYVDKKEPLHSNREIVMNIFFIYILSVIYVTMKPFHFDIPFLVGRNYSFDFHLFYNLRHMASSHFEYQLLYSLGNILMLIPFGLLFPTLFKSAHGFFKIVLLGFLLSLTIEVTQTFFTPTRRGTVDDLFFNTTGAAIGYILFVIVRSLSEKSRFLQRLFRK